MSSFDSEIVDINVYALQLLKETCPTMDESERLKVAKNLIEEATVEVNRREKLRRPHRRKAKLTAQISNHESQRNPSSLRNRIPVLANNYPVYGENADTNFHGSESFHNRSETTTRYYENQRHKHFSANKGNRNYPPWNNQNNCENYGMAPYNNFNGHVNWRNGYNKYMPTYNYHQKKKK